MTAEHLFAKWLYERETTHEERLNTSGTNHGLTVRKPSGDLTRADGFLHRKNLHPLNVTSKVVCKGCNSGWMSKIDGKMSEIYKTLFDDGETQISSEAATHIDRWIYLKSLVHEASFPMPDIDEQLRSALIAEQSDRRRWFMETKSTPLSRQAYVTRRAPMDGFEVGAFNFQPFVTIASQPARVTIQSLFVAAAGELMVVQLPSECEGVCSQRGLDEHRSGADSWPTFVNLTRVSSQGESGSLPLQSGITMRDADDLLRECLPQEMRSAYSDYMCPPPNPWKA